MELQNGHRLKKVNSLIQEEVGKIINEELDLPKDTLVTIISADTSLDIKHVKIYFSVLPKHKSLTIAKLLNNKIALIQRYLNRRLVMKFVPQIRFELDVTQDKILRIEELLEKNKK